MDHIDDILTLLTSKHLMVGWKSEKPNITSKKMVICTELGEVSGKMVESWKEQLPEILEGYTAQDIWNIDETGCFWRALLREEKFCHGGKKSKLRVTVALFVNAAGNKEKPGNQQTLEALTLQQSTLTNVLL